MLSEQVLFSTETSSKLLEDAEANMIPSLERKTTSDQGGHP